MAKSKIKISVSGGDVNVKGPKAKKEDAGFDIKKMFIEHKSGDIIDFGSIMKEFKNTAAYKILETRNFNEIKRLIFIGPTSICNAEQLCGRLKGLLDGFEAAIEEFILNANNIVNQEKLRKKQDKEKDEGVIDPHV